MPNTLLKNPVSIDVVSTSIGLSVSGTAAAATAGSGAQPANTLSVEGVTGQETTGTGEAAGAGAHVSIIAGSGGAAPAGSTTGNGGSVTINPGQPGSGAGTPGANGHVLLATTGGNVGIGNSAPTNRLNVNGDVRVNALGVNIAPGEDGTFGVGGVQNPNVYLNSTTASSDLYLQNSEGRFDVLAHDGATVNMSVTNDGHVGIGTTSPGSDLEVNGGVRANALAVNMAPGGTGTFAVGGVQNPNVHLSSTTASSDVYLQNSAGRLDILGNDGATATVSVTNVGNVGIGTTSPANRLEISGGVRASSIGVNMASGILGRVAVGGVQNPNVQLSSTTASSDVYLQNSAGRLDVLGNDGTTVNLSVTNGGYIGIGTTDPQKKLVVQDDNSGSVPMVALCNPNTTDGNGSSLSFRGTTTGAGASSFFEFASIECLVQKHDAGTGASSLGFSTTNNHGLLTEKVRLSSLGRLGIGTSAPTQPLQVVGSNASNDSTVGFFASATGTGLSIGGGAAGSTVNIFSDYLAGSEPKLHLATYSNKSSSAGITIDTAGKVGIGTSSPGSKLHVNGGVQVGAPTGGDKGTGSINISGDIYKNGTPQFSKLEELAKRIARLEAQLTRQPRKPKKLNKPKTKKKSSKSGKEKR